MEKELVLNIRLVGAEVDVYELAKEKTGIRSNSEFIRFLVSQYAKE